LQVIRNIEHKAKSFLGVPYVWGATGPSKFDCSGFTQWVYRDSGINIPRVSKDQARVGEFIAYANLQRGDMVFFDTKKKRTGRVSHVGIYLGNNDFIHASSAGKSVVIYNFNKKIFYKKRFLWGRRVLKPNFHYALN
jgi:cell wall-associated NlpC family hydrolase